jgi:hypothetical protein
VRDGVHTRVVWVLGFHPISCDIWEISRTMVRMRDDRFHELHHGTGASRVNSIHEMGLFPPEPSRQPRCWAMLTTRWGTPGVSRTVTTYRVPKDMAYGFL